MFAFTSPEPSSFSTPFVSVSGSNIFVYSSTSFSLGLRSPSNIDSRIAWVFPVNVFHQSLPHVFSSTNTDGKGPFFLVRTEALPDQRFYPSILKEDLFELFLPNFHQQGVFVPIPDKPTHMPSNTLQATLATFVVVRYSDLGSFSSCKGS